jgi:hypothetical protein
MMSERANGFKIFTRKLETLGRYLTKWGRLFYSTTF